MKNAIPALGALLAAALLAGPPAFAQQGAESKPATATTASANEVARKAMAMNDKQDFDDATRGKLSELKDPLVKAADGRMVWDTKRYDFIKGDAPATVNPSLWRQQKLNTAAGFFKVADGIYQIRGYDLANITLVEGATGWIVIDAMLTEDVARAGMKLAMETLKSTKPVVAVIYTHSHADHFGGIRGVVDEADVRSGKVKLIAPEGFMDNAVAENVLAGNAMSRRANYMYGVSLPANEKGSVGTGLGLALSLGAPGLIPPNVTIKKTGEEMTIDGVRIQFQMAQNTEAPSEFMFYFPDKKALCLSEVATKLMHNVYTIRGAKVRDALVWSKYINETLDLFPDAQVAFASHHWPTWGSDNIRQFLANQRDTYRFLHDRALNLANQGLVMDELGNEPFFPKSLATDAASRGYYGTLSHNLRAVYNFYLGFYDANPASTEARNLQADALEQLGYQAESATWRNAYLMGALELRAGPKTAGISTTGPDAVRGMNNELLFDFIALRLNHEKTDGIKAAISMVFTDSNEVWALELSNSVLNNTKGRVLKNPDVTITLTRPAFLAMLLQGKKIPELVQAGLVKVEGDPRGFGAVVANIVNFEPVFNIVTP